MKLSIIICVYNEIKTIKEILQKVNNVNLSAQFEKEIIIVDNNSKDGTKEFLKNLVNSNQYNIIFQKKNFGKGNSIITGIKEVSGDLVVFQDADLEYDPNNYVKLINHLNKNKLDAVFGSRVLNDKDYFYYKLNKFVVIKLTRLINFLFDGSFTDVATNHKLIKTKVLKKLNLVSKGFNLDFEISLKLAKYKFKCGEIPISYLPRTYKEGKKINFIDAIKSILVIFYFYFRS
jgi:dolichol-phosphate mannosyltransferase|tara:strand:+ start:224 stop:919 length:696 start_codon:yes stop_codon:yes gene_type:complete